ncbi:peptidase domain-containing ABC transporter [Reyranella sp.]|uniref:peptidase domain-containing ABC transporter n=1 Tax=Reyranella sp. TaxID=1929291 RepID=UPI002F952368
MNQRLNLHIAATGERHAPAVTPAGEVNDFARVDALIAVARHHGVELDRVGLRGQIGRDFPSPAALAAWAHDAGLWARAARLRWRHLIRMRTDAPLVLLLADGGAAIVVGRDAKAGTVLLKDPQVPGAEPIAVDELRLGNVWRGDALLVRRGRGTSADEEPFSFWWIARLVLQERRSLREITVASIGLSVLQILPPFLIMIAIDRVLTHQTMSTLVMISLMLVLSTVYETLLGYARREIVEVTSTRIDARLALHVFRRLLALPVDFFERNPTGETTHKVAQIFRIRDFLTGKLVGTFLDVFTLVALLPFLFWMSATLAWMVLAASTVVALVVMAFLPAIRRVFARLIVAENSKHAVLVETVYGMRTVKSLGIEKVRNEEWDARVAEAGKARLDAGRISNVAQTVVNPIEAFINRGVLLVGAYIVLVEPAGSTGITAGALIAFMLLGTRVASPLIGLAKLMQDLEEVRMSVRQVSEVLNHPTEAAAMRTGVRPKFEGAIAFQDLTFTYPAAKTAALDRISFEVPAGTMLGLVGRSGSGKSTIARLLQGISRDYGGYLKIDGTDLREINLTHLRRSFGVVLQDNFLFRGSVRDNIIAGRPGLTLEHAIRAARLAGAEEFIERLPRGYESWIEEGSANLSGGQRQRLAIARALVSDPRLLILDEATSALDPESEALINANLLRMAKGRTMIIVSHRLSSLVDCDQILVLDKGTVADIGPHEEILERCPVYRALWQQQNRHMDGAQRRLLRSVTPGELAP